MRIGFVEWPDGLNPESKDWESIKNGVAERRPDLLITNELPFGPWLSALSSFDYKSAKASVDLHEDGLKALSDLKLPMILSSRPIMSKKILINEAFLLHGSSYLALHQKGMFPSEPGWHETEWFEPGAASFDIHQMGTFKVGTLLCTELMFNERARVYGRAGAHLIAVPRATGIELTSWKTAAAMAAIVSGAYVVSSNRKGQVSGEFEFGGVGFAFGLDGSLLAETSSKDTLQIIEADSAVSEKQKYLYPVYVQSNDY